MDGTGFHQLSDGSHTDFNPTWTRDGKNTPIWNRKNDRTRGFFVVQGRVGGQPGQEKSLTDEGFHNWVYSSLADGRLLGPWRLYTAIGGRGKWGGPPAPIKTAH